MMEMEEKKFVEKLQKMPFIETKISKSKDNKSIIVRTIFTQIYSRKYFEKVLEENKE